MNRTRKLKHRALAAVLAVSMVGAYVPTVASATAG